MSVGAISTSNVNAIKGTEFEGMSIQMMAAMAQPRRRKLKTRLPR
ncbi:hypothetical protein [Succinivibrio dextrinosolvens]|nr:hypothetical protein [Succinivibrio dextrinosolvens]